MLLSSRKSHVGRRPRRSLGFALIGTLSLLLPAPGSAQEKSFILAHGFGTDHFVHAVGEQFVARLQELSGGALQPEYHPGGDLGDYTQQFEQTMRGGIEMTLAGPAPDLDARLNISYLAYVIDDWEGARELYGPGGPMVDVLGTVTDDLNLELLGMIPGGFGNIAVRRGVDRRPVSFPEDAAGFKMRVPPFEIGVRRFEAWGFAAMPIPYSELYTALQLGTVDGRSFGPPTEIIEMQDVIGAYILTRDYFDTGFWVVNKDWYNGLSEEERGWIRTAAEEAMTESWETGEQKEAEDLERIRGFDIEIVELTEEQMEKAKAIVYETEWPWMETIVGEDLMNEVRAAAGISE